MQPSANEIPKLNMHSSADKTVKSDINPSPKIKICGLKRREDIRFANYLHPDYIGFVFANKGHRHITPMQAQQLYELLDHSIQAVGVFLNEPLSSLEAILSLHAFDIIQLHGTEDNSYVSSLRTLTDKPIIQAFSVRYPSDIALAEASKADYILLDGTSAGSGIPFDWKLLAFTSRPFFLAGGLSPDNILEALETVNPFGIDVSSGVETNQYKDFYKMQSLISLVRNRQFIHPEHV